MTTSASPVHRPRVGVETAGEGSALAAIPHRPRLLLPLSLPVTSPTSLLRQRSGFLSEAQAPASHMVKMSSLLVEARFKAIVVRSS